VIVTSAGLNIFPEDIETKLRQVREIRDCVVLPIRSGSEEEPCAILLPEAGEFSAEEAIKEGNSQLAEYQRVRRWAIWPEADFPRTSTGKPRLPAIAARLPELLGEKSGRAAATDAFAGLPFAMPADGSLESLSSLDRVELMSAVEQRYNVELNETAFSEAKTVADVQRLLRQPAAKKSEYSYPRWRNANRCDGFGSPFTMRWSGQRR